MQAEDEEKETDHSFSDCVELIAGNVSEQVKKKIERYFRDKYNMVVYIDLMARTLEIEETAEFMELGLCIRARKDVSRRNLLDIISINEDIVRVS